MERRTRELQNPQGKKAMLGGVRALAQFSIGAVGRGCHLWDTLSEEKKSLCAAGGEVLGCPMLNPSCSLQGYHEFCLNFAMVSMMLLQKEPSMEGVLMKALRANLRELRHRLLKEMEDFIQQYDVTHPSC